MKLFATAFLILLSSQASAGIEKIAAPSESGIRMMWWPKADPPRGWHFDKGSSYHFSFNAIAPDGSSFSKAETVIYARADFKPRISGSKSLDSYIANDMVDFKKSDSRLTITREQPIRSRDHTTFQVVSYSPRKGGSSNWERVAYGEDGDFYLTFVISSRTKDGLKNSLPAFTKFIAGYRSGA